MKKITALLFALLSLSSARADIYVIVASSNPLQSLTQKEVQSLYMGRSRALVPGDFAQVLDLPRDTPVRDQFYLALTGMSPAQVNSYWARLVFTGQTLPPKEHASEQAIIEQVRRNKAAIGYVSKEPTDASLRTILVIKTHSPS